MKLESPTNELAVARLPRRLLEFLPYLVSSLHKESRRYFENGAEGFLFPHFSIVSSLEEFGASSQQALCLRLGYDKSDMAKIIEGLDKKGVIQRRTDPTDKRKQLIMLSAQGKKLLRLREKDLRLISENIFKNLNSKEQQMLVHLLRKTLSKHDPKFSLDK